MLDRLGGAVFGFVRGSSFGKSAVLMAFTGQFLPTAPWIRDSLLAPYFLQGAHAVSFLVPQDLRSKLCSTERESHQAHCTRLDQPGPLASHW